MITVGVTGGIGSGKSLLCEFWRDHLGAELMNADAEAKKLMETDPELVQQIREHFGEDSYTNEGKLNRNHLSKEAFRNNRVEELNHLVHPAVIQETERRIEEARQKGVKVFVKEAALLLKYGRPSKLDVIVMVTAPDHLRIQRVAGRDNLTAEEVKSRMDRQQSLQELSAYADYVLENSGDRQQFLERGEQLFHQIIATSDASG